MHFVSVNKADDYIFPLVNIYTSDTLKRRREKYVSL